MTHHYDNLNQWIGREVTTFVGGSEVSFDREGYIHDDGQITLAFDDTDLTDRYLWADGVDQLLSEEALHELTGEIALEAERLVQPQHL